MILTVDNYQDINFDDIDASSDVTVDAKLMQLMYDEAMGSMDYTPDEKLSQMISNGGFLYSIAENKETSAEVLGSLLGLAESYETSEIVAAIAGNKNTSEDTLFEIGDVRLYEEDEYGSWEVKSELAQNENTPLGHLEILAEDRDESMRYYVARNKKLSIETLEKLASDRDEDVRRVAPKTIRQKLLENFQ